MIAIRLLLSALLIVFRQVHFVMQLWEVQETIVGVQKVFANQAYEGFIGVVVLS